VLDKSVAYDPSVMPQDKFTAPSALVASNEYSVQSLIHFMIVDSDNGATFTLLNHINQDFLTAVYSALGIKDPGDDASAYKISARTYGLFFRVLYNATYLSPNYSERALKLLSEATFTDGLVAGVPEGTVVAHKYGDHILNANGSVTGVELSDCGIVYYPAHPYLLCVMAGAYNTPDASSIIANLSRAAYAAISFRYATSTTSSL
jgi:beta-lactamase class A